MRRNDGKPEHFVVEEQESAGCLILGRGAYVLFRGQRGEESGDRFGAELRPMDAGGRERSRNA
jgi:hypothetical protein